MINPLHLKTFLSLVQTRHFTQTAHQLNMTQPGVSQHLKALEQELGSVLFVRDGKVMELSTAGEKFLNYAQQAVSAEEEFRRDLQGDDPFKGDIRIACSGTMASLLYPHLLVLQRQHRDLHISLEAAPNASIIKALKSNEIDLGLVSERVSDKQIDALHIGYEALCLVTPKGSNATWEGLKELGFINHPNGAHYLNQVCERNFPDHFPKIKEIPQVGYINQLSQILLPVAQGIGFTVLPESTVNEFEHRDQIDKAALSVACLEDVYLVTKKYKPLPARYDIVCDCLGKLWKP